MYVCSRFLFSVYCACCLANHDLRGLGRKIKPHFYVNVADIETLESEVTYIACKYEGWNTTVNPHLSFK